MANQNVFDNSIWLIGPVGSGKTVLSKEVGKRTKMPVINLDVLRHCPHSIEELDQRIIRFSAKAMELKREISRCKDDTQRYLLNAELEKVMNHKWEATRQKEMRTMLPNVPNYKDMGFDIAVSRMISQKLGKVAWHFYQKQFEIKLMRAVVEQLQVPCVIDCGGGMSVSLDKDYKRLSQKYEQKNSAIFHKYFDDTVCFNDIKLIIEPFGKVIELKQPNRFQSGSLKASLDELNSLFVGTGQYGLLATHSVSVEGMIKKKNPNWTKVDEIAKEIVKIYKKPTHVMDK